MHSLMWPYSEVGPCHPHFTDRGNRGMKQSDMTMVTKRVCVYPGLTMLSKHMSGLEVSSLGLKPLF